jgi:hypothetical protein
MSMLQIRLLKKQGENPYNLRYDNISGRLGYAKVESVDQSTFNSLSWRLCGISAGADLINRSETFSIPGAILSQFDSRSLVQSLFSTAERIQLRH